MQTIASSSENPRNLRIYTISLGAVGFLDIRLPYKMSWNLSLTAEGTGDYGYSMISANQVEKALHLPEGEATEGGGAFGLLCGLLMSLAITAFMAIGVCVYFLGPTFRQETVIMGVVVATWMLAYLIGAAVKDSVNLSDSAPSRSSYSDEENGEADGMGCVLALLQFIFGNIYVCTQGLLGRDGRDISPLATPIVTLMANQPSQSFDLTELFNQLRASGVECKPRPLRKVLAWLAKENWLHGSLESGYRINPARLQALQ